MLFSFSVPTKILLTPIGVLMKEKLTNKVGNIFLNFPPFKNGFHGLLMGRTHCQLFLVGFFSSSGELSKKLSPSLPLISLILPRHHPLDHHHGVLRWIPTFNLLVLSLWHSRRGVPTTCHTISPFLVRISCHSHLYLTHSSLFSYLEWGLMGLSILSIFFSEKGILPWFWNFHMSTHTFLFWTK